MKLIRGLHIGIAIGLLSTSVEAKSPTTTQPSPEPTRAMRVNHAQELMGKYYQASVVRQGEKHRRLDRFIKDWTRQSLPMRNKKDAETLAKTILATAKKHDFDPVLLMAVIESESSFNPVTLGGHGEIGLMQILPTTGAWMAREAGVKWRGKKTLLDPEANVKIGAAFLAWLRERFDSHAQLYLAAYNMGQRNVDYALSKDVWPQDYPFRVMNHYVKYYTELKITSKRNGERTLASRPKKKIQTLPVLTAEAAAVRKAKRAVGVRPAKTPQDDTEFQQLREFEQEANHLIGSADQ